MNRIAMGLMAGLVTFATAACSHDHARSNSGIGGGPSGAEASYGQRKGAGQMNRGDYGMYGDPNVSTSGNKPMFTQPIQGTGGGPGASAAPTSSSSPSSGRPWYDDVR